VGEREREGGEDTHDALGGAGGEGELVVRPVVPVKQISGLLADVGVEPWRHGCRRRRRREGGDRYRGGGGEGG
jgi:hypothetical protein